MVSKFNPIGMQEKWLQKWKNSNIFQAKPDPRKKKFYLTVAFPYPSGSMHVGHGRTYTVPDVIARFKRMQGFNVLFPMAWHVTGSPVLGVAERIKKRDEKTLKVYGDLYKVPKKELDSFVNPENIVRYFSREYKENMIKMGFSIDWSREFFSITPQYSKFIEWQYKKLYDQGLVRKGEHPVRYCPSCDNPVGDHDLLEGEDASINEFVVLKFKFDGLILPAATLRPETIFGVTNMWLNPKVIYQKTRVDGEKWLLSKEAVEKLEYCDKKIEILDEIKGEELIGNYCIDPVGGKKVPILPAEFVDPDYATGVVMSVPAHAPYDYVALRDLESSIEAIPIIEVRGGIDGEILAKKIVEEMNIKDQNDKKKLEEATEILYKKEHSKGQMLSSIEKYGGLSVSEAREKLTRNLLDSGRGDIFYEFSEKPVICRCGTRCVIKILKDQWFVEYSNREWKKKAEECLGNMRIIPEETRENFSYFVEWLKDWACTRKVGLGTKLPWDRKWIIEPLSDSTIYMAYYTIAAHLKEINEEKLKPEFFDYVFLGKDNLDEIPKGKLDEIRDEFRYWYPSEWRLSAKDLVGNHLTFHIFHHTAIFPNEFWPKGIVVFGMGLFEGNKMSSSKGNVILLSDAIKDYGSDTARLFLMSNAEPWQDFDWRESLVENTAKKLKQFYDQINYAIALENKIDIRDIDRWLMGRMQEAIKKTTESLENFQIRKALQHAFFDVLNDLVWYSRRCEPNESVMKEFTNSWIRLMAPFTPFTCEELWWKMHGGKEGFLIDSEFPKAKEGLINERINYKEEIIKNLMKDIQNILEVTKVKPKRIYLYLAPEWKRKIFDAIKSEKGISDVMKDPELKPYYKEISKMMKMRKDEIPKILLSLDEEYVTLDDAKEFLQNQFNAEIKIEKKVEYDPANKAKLSLPMKPGIYAE